MRKILFSGTTLLALFLIISGAVLLGMQEKEAEKPLIKVKIKTTTPMSIAYLEHKGPYSELEPVFNKVMSYAMQKNLELAGPPVGIYYDDPAQVPASELRCEIGVQVKGKPEVDPPFRVKEIPSQEIGYALLKGPYEKIALHYPEIISSLMAQGYKIVGPIIEIYRVSGPNIQPEEYLTEVWFPVAK